MQALQKLFEIKILTEIQERRIKRIFEGLSFGQITMHEQVHFTLVAESINSVMDKLKKIKKFSVFTHTPPDVGTVFYKERCL